MTVISGSHEDSPTKFVTAVAASSTCGVPGAILHNASAIQCRVYELSSKRGFFSS